MDGLDGAFGKRLKELRARAGLSQAELARRLKLPQSAVSRLETGARGVTLGELIALAALFECPVGELIGAPAAKAAPAPPAAGQSFSPGFPSAFESIDAALAHLARHGIKFLGIEPRPALASLPVEEVVLSALRHAGDPRLFEAVPALLVEHALVLDWTKLCAGAYALRLQNRLGMAVAAGLQLREPGGKRSSRTWSVLKAVHDELAESKLAKEDVLGPKPRTPESRRFLESRTPAWLKFWNALGTADVESFRRHLPA